MTLLAAVLDALDEPMAIKRPDLRYLHANAAFGEILGRTPESMRDVLDQDLFPASTASLLTEEDQRVLDEAEEAVTETRLPVEGQELEVYIHRRPILDREGEVTALLLRVECSESFREQTSDFSLDEKLIATQKQESLAALAGGLAHDFNNILMAISGNADLGLMTSAEGSGEKECFEEIKKASARAADLCNQMRAYASKGKAVLESMDLSELLDQMAAMIRASITRRVDVKFQSEPSLPDIQGDRMQLRQALLNLTTNAIEAIGDNSQGTIKISTGAEVLSEQDIAACRGGQAHRAGQYAYLEVEDTGSGMDGESKARLFDPFYTTKQVGRGLGMASVDSIVRVHRGLIHVDSQPEQGTRVRLYFPA